MFGLLLFIGAIFILLVFLHLRHTNSRLYRLVEFLHKGNDLKPLPFVGNGLKFSQDTYYNYNLLEETAKRHERMYRIWFGHTPAVFLYDPKDIEVVLTSSTHIQKTDPYRNAVPWIGTGLLTSSGAKWKTRRKIITPTFHFKILESFVGIFEENNKILLAKLGEKANGLSLDVMPYCNLYALDVICETAMRVRINAQTNVNSKYVKAVKTPHLAFDFIFNNSSWGAKQRESLAVIHGLTRSTIRQRQMESKAQKQDPEDEADSIFEKKKLTFLDLLLESAEKEGLTDEDIREEVDTFMFEGHDTTGSGLSFILYCLSQNSEAQERVYAEQMEILGNVERAPTFKEYQEMKYLERVVKESERLYPSVPIVARLMHEDLVLSDGVVLPKGVRAHLGLPFVHRNAKYWKDPETFNPDNFLPEIAADRHPFAFIPFSAGPRNCIGQKYAMLEVKSCIGAVVRNFKLLPCSHDEKPKPYSEIVLISKTGVNVRLIPRAKN